MQRISNNLAELATMNGSASQAMNHQIETFVDLLQHQMNGPHGYRLRRILLTNFWLYGQQEFEIPHGRLFLAGENASGKSTVLTAALPLALDGDLRPNRIDTFGGRERHIEYYVLGGTESATPFNYERRTAYIALEFEWCDPDNPPIAQEIRQQWENGNREKARFLTIGISLAGNVNASDHIRPLRFLITDGSRLGYELHTTYETGNKHDRRAYDHAHFKQQMEGHGIICDSQADYERQVARYLFGFSDEKAFQKLIDLLLVLRRPNLSTELNFSRVHEHLKQSLRKISGETTSRVIGTIERIDAIQSEIERIQEAYNAADRLHQACQQVAQVRAQLAACEYRGAQLTEDHVLSRVTKLRKDLFTADNDRQRAESQTQTYQTELSQVNGQIKALEASEGLQVATQLTVVRERVQEAKAQMHMQQQSLEAVRHALHEQSKNLERQRVRFEKIKQENISHLNELRLLASEETRWEVAAFQLEEASSHVSIITTDATTQPEIPFGIASLIEAESEERITRLRHLEELHQQKEHLETKVQYTRSLETTRFQELDDTRRRFQSAQDRADEIQQQLKSILTQLFTGNTFTYSLDTLATISQLQGDMTDDESLAGRAVEQLATAIKAYRQAISEFEHDLIETADQAQGELNELQLLAGSKGHEIAEINALYEQKLSEPEFMPLRSDRHTIARQRLAEQGIAALPLYALLDFAPDIESDDAGRIEYMLEDAGLLDALVVIPEQVVAADTLLATEGLSDCRLNIEAITSVQETDEERSHQWLRFDPTIHDSSEKAWETIVATILPALSCRTSTLTGTICELKDDNTWTHGLLTGRTGRGSAKCIGKATRLRVRQREIDELHEKRTQLENELQWLHGQLAHYEQQLTDLQEQQSRLRKVLPESGIEEIYAELAQTRFVLDDARGKYQKARVQTQEARQACNLLTAQLERESKEIAPFAGNTKHIQRVLIGTMKLKNQAQSLHHQLTNLLHSWEEYQQTREAHESGKSNEANVTLLYERLRHQVLQAQAEEGELLRVAESANATELSTRLHQLREQSAAFITKIDEAKTDYVRADERAKSTEDALADAELDLQQVQKDRIEKQAHFITLLTAYPVAELLVIQQLAERRDVLRAAEQLITKETTLRESDIANKKAFFEEQYREVYNALSRAFNREQALLLEYGPDLDDQGHVVFLNEGKCQPVELLKLLSNHIEMQRTLLGQEDRQLFEDFLLQEIAEAIRTHILEAEEWVQQVNSVLSGLPLIGEHYALQWKSLAEYDPAKPGSHLAPHHKILRKPAQTLTAEETETLMGAFRHEIEAMRIRQQENPDMSFMEALEKVFDYREWFHFDVLVTPVGGLRQRLTDRMAGTRSGAEQLFALYVPLFAALAALYSTAAPGAPRLLALDEAFDKVSGANTQRIMEFLVSQDFQWIMTGPQISGAGAKIPACARYLMIHEKGAPVATASASFWSESQKL